MKQHPPLPIDFAEHYRLQDYYVSEANRQAFDIVGDGKNRFIFLHGEAADGKTHLAHVFCEIHGGRLLSPQELQKGYEDITIGTGFFAVDDVEFLSMEAQMTLFHVYNRLQADNHGALLLTSKLSPQDIVTHNKTIGGIEGGGLQDWHSRLSGFLLCEIMEHRGDDILVTEILNKNLRERQIYLTSHVLRYIIKKNPRGLDNLRKFAMRLHEYKWNNPKENITKKLCDKLL